MAGLSVFYRCGLGDFPIPSLFRLLRVPEASALRERNEPGERVARQPVAAATCSRGPNGFGLATP